MKILGVTWKHRFDFDALAECEFCGNEQILKNGYDDSRFHNQVVPAIKCIKCDKRTNDEVPEGISDPGYQGAVKALNESSHE